MAPKEFPSLPDERLKEIVHQLTQYGLANGLIMYPPAPFLENQPVLAPVTLFPTPFPREEFNKSLQIQKIYNKLYANIVAEQKWLTNVIEQLSQHDVEFTGRLWKSFLNAKQEGIPQNLSLALTRSDYMFDEISQEIKQVEYNTVSVSFGGLSHKVGSAHTYLNQLGLYSSFGSERYYTDNEIPISESDKRLADGLFSGVEYYNKEYLNGENKSIVLVVVQPDERNAFDQRALEYHLLNNYGVVSKRVNLPDVLKSIKIDSHSKRLYYQNWEVSVVYYRSAYSPAEFDSPDTWECRTVLESSMAIKCPSLLTQLSGSKKIQQLLTSHEILSKFIDQAEIKQIETSFCDIYPLDNSVNGKIAKKLAFEKPQNFVLKPQREGGGNNIYKEDIPEFLNSIPEDEWEAYILMDLIHPTIHKNLILRNGEILTDGIVSELGVFGSYLFNEKTGEILDNQVLGHLLRSKTSTSNEGGVAAGFGCVDNPYLY
ncbi:hypothetical protein CANINC_002616 [Pichia inconspicua]|uniref:Glutathione synthetase n=1 Tax=Pichia inconspicua TaxID=52247 RepID=A0A4T0X0M6_9ASCO|nr:hypothetical protein CANINC_002616 [[Candida] inconspicua]